MKGTVISLEKRRDERMSFNMVVSFRWMVIEPRRLADMIEIVCKIICNVYDRLIFNEGGNDSTCVAIFFGDMPFACTG